MLAKYRCGPESDGKKETEKTNLHVIIFGENNLFLTVLS
jgi:hypothetical protein